MNEDNLKYLLDRILDRDTKVLYKPPNTTLKWYGKDEPKRIKYKGIGQGAWPLPTIIQNHDWTNEDIEYKFNSMGLRCPELDTSKKTKLLFAGGSFMMGTGVHEHQTFPHKLSDMMDASYINLSDSDSLLGLLEPILETAEWYKPDYLILGDTRFVDEYGWIVRFTEAKIVNSLDKELRSFMLRTYKRILCERNYTNICLMLEHLSHKLNIPIIFMISNRKDFKIDREINVPGVEILNCEWCADDITQCNFIDLARDNGHPGPRSHEIITLELYDLLTQSS